MLETMQAFMDWLGDEDISYDYSDEMDAVRIQTETDGAGLMEVIIGFADEGNTVAIRCEEFFSFKAANRQAMLEACNRLNLDYRWVRFGVYDEDNTVLMAMDVDLEAYVREGDPVSQIRWGVDTLIEIGEEVYPEFTRATLTVLS